MKPPVYQNKDVQAMLTELSNDQASRGRSLMTRQRFQYGDDINGQNGEGETDLMIAIKSKHYETVYDLLITSYKYSKYGKQPLEVKVDLADKNGNTPLMAAVEAAKKDKDPNMLIMIKLLVDQGAQSSIQNKAGESAESLAKGNPEIENLLTARPKASPFL